MSVVADARLGDRTKSLLPAVQEVLGAGARIVRFAGGTITSTGARIEAARADGATHVLVAADATSVIADDSRPRAHLARYPLAIDEDAYAVYDLRAPLTGDAMPVAARLATIVGEYRDRYGREPVILDWSTGVALERQAPTIEVFEPFVQADGTLPYLDSSIDVVAVAAEDATSVREAERVASRGLITVLRQSGAATLGVRWLAPPTEMLSSVSIIIPTYNRAGLLAACLRTVRETVPPYLGVQIVVVDDASSDETADVIDALAERDDRLRVVRNQANMGFIGAVNRGAEIAGGDVLVFLNNDTLALPGWVESLLRTMRTRADAGAIGGRLLFPDGRLQEAGGVVFRDGSTANFGYGDDDPDAEPYAYVREVDYVSGALMATPRATFDRLGRFDPSFGFGYYEDTDYCFRLRREGLRVYYQPDSVIVHRGGATAGVDESQGPKRFQAINRSGFAERWREVLGTHPNPPDQWLTNGVFPPAMQ